jgi:hypothetical protein
VIPVSAARAERDAIAEATNADAARRTGPDPLQMARRIAAALNAPGNPGADDFGFFWATGVTTDGTIVVANSYGLAYIPDGVRLPEPVHMASADATMPIADRARWATYPIMAVRTWADFRKTTLRAIIATTEQLANSDPGVATVALKPDDIPASGDMTGRSRLEVVDPAAAARLARTPDPQLTSLLPPAPAGTTQQARGPAAPVGPPDDNTMAELAASLAAGTLSIDDLYAQLSAGADAADRRPTLWFAVIKPMTTSATGRERPPEGNAGDGHVLRVDPEPGDHFVADGGGDRQEQPRPRQPFNRRCVGEPRPAAGEIALGIDQGNEVVDDRAGENLGPVENPGHQPGVVGHRRQPEKHGRLAGARREGILNAVAESGDLGGGRSQRRVREADDRHITAPQGPGGGQEESGVRADAAACETGILKATEVGVDKHRGE